VYAGRHGPHYLVSLGAPSSIRPSRSSLAIGFQPGGSFAWTVRRQGSETRQRSQRSTARGRKVRPTFRARLNVAAMEAHGPPLAREADRLVAPGVDLCRSCRNLSTPGAFWIGGWTPAPRPSEGRRINIGPRWTRSRLTRQASQFSALRNDPLCTRPRASTNCTGSAPSPGAVEDLHRTEKGARDS